jgi:hypothetical protein
MSDEDRVRQSDRKVKSRSDTARSAIQRLQEARKGKKVSELYKGSDDDDLYKEDEGEDLRDFIEDGVFCCASGPDACSLSLFVSLIMCLDTGEYMEAERAEAEQEDVLRRGV